MTFIEKILNDPLMQSMKAEMSKEEVEEMEAQITEMLQGANSLYLKIMDMSNTETGREDLASSIDDALEKAGERNVKK